MMKTFNHLLVLVLSQAILATGVSGQCSPDTCEKKEHDITSDLDTYYASTVGLGGSELKTQLNSIIRDHHRYGYSPCVWVALTETEEDEENPDNVISIYTQRSIPKLRRDCGKDDGDSWNCEHIWAKSHGFPKQGQHAYTDFHHLVPADKSVNSDQSNYDFKMGGAPNDECDGCKEGDRTWEPPDLVKGQVARMLFYMDVRYDGDDDSKTPDLNLVDQATGKGPEIGYLSDLLEWHCKYPVTDRERRRNDIVQSWQGNRNPFIDNPEFVESVWNIATSCCGGKEKEDEKADAILATGVSGQCSPVTCQKKEHDITLDLDTYYASTVGLGGSLMRVLKNILSKVYLPPLKFCTEISKPLDHQQFQGAMNEH